MVLLGHGASGTAASMRPHVEGLRSRGIDARTVHLPRRRAELAVDHVARFVAGLRPATSPSR